VTDVNYRKGMGFGGLILFEEWTSERPVEELSESLEKVEPYQPGSFFRRELPCLLKLLDRVRGRFDTVLIDGYVWLGPENNPGLGAHLYRALEERVPVIGVAKTPFKGSANAQWVFRGRSRRPLYVTAAGIDPASAAQNIERMHGPHRIPSLLKRVDRLCRDAT
jgi:deoxyribonuclease V